MKKIIIPIILSTIAVVFLLSFIEIDSKNNDISNVGVVYAANNIPSDLEKVTNLNKRDEDFICATSRGLVEKDKDGKIIPSLAKEINVKDDGIEYEFILNDNIFWSNGDKIESTDIVKFFKELIKYEDDENIGPFLEVYGAKDFKEGKVTFEDGVAISSEDNSVKIRLNKKEDDFLNTLTKPQYRVRKHLSLWNDLYNTYDEIVYSGEYSITSINSTSMELVKNNKSTDNAPNKISVVKDDTEELSMASFEMGNRDIVIDPPESELNRLGNEKKLITMPSEEGSYVVLNSNSEKLSSIDRREIYKLLYNATEEYEGENSRRLESAEGSYFREDKNDLAKLQTRKVSINKEESWNKPEVVTLMAIDNNQNRDFCKYIKNWFKDKEGIELRYSLVNKSDMLNMDLQKRYSLLLINESANDENRKEFYSKFEQLYTEKEIELFKAAVESNDSNFKKLEEELFSSYRILPIIFENRNIAVSDKINNIFLDGNGNIRFSFINKS